MRPVDERGRALPKVDAAVFADTGWEPKAVYEHLEYLKEIAGLAGIPVHTVSLGDIKDDALHSRRRGKDVESKRHWSPIPYFTLGPNGEKGQVKRQCTYGYKIVPVERFIRRELLGLKKGQRAPLKSVRQWFGISADEMRRVRVSKMGWLENIYPLIGLPDEMLEKPYRRHNCIEWVSEHFPGIDLVRSACIGCPYHSNAEWRRLKDESPDEFADAVKFDEDMREAHGMRGKLFLHADRIPLKDVDLSTPEDHGQGVLFADDCVGMCGV